jgi:hypothetical protein
MRNSPFASKLKDFALFNGCTKIVIEKADKEWKKKVLPDIGKNG